MKFKCPLCGKVFKRDLRNKANKRNFFEGKYESFCKEYLIDTKSKKIN